MCGRLSQATPAKALQAQFGVDETLDLDVRYNVAPMQLIAAIRQLEGKRTLTLLRWALLPSWAKPEQMKAPLINARLDTVAEKPSFRSAYKSRRCIIPADGWYEWLREGKAKQPFFLHDPDGRVLAFAGLWERWKGPDDALVESCTIITTEASEAIRHIHDRMPLILEPSFWQAWLDPATQIPPEMLLAVQAPSIAFHPVSPFVNSARNEGPECSMPINSAPPLLTI